MHRFLLVLCLVVTPRSLGVMAGLKMEEMESMLKQMHGNNYAQKARVDKEETMKEMTPEEKVAQKKRDEEHHDRVTETVRKFQEDQKRGLNPDIGRLLDTITGGAMGSSSGGQEAPNKVEKGRKIDLNEDISEDYAAGLDEL